MEPADFAFSQIRHTLDLARTAINQQKPEDAMELLRTVRNEAERAGGALCAEHRLLLADAYAATTNPVADTFFVEAVELIGNLSERRPELELRVNEHYGDHLVRSGARSAGRDRYEAAKRIAVEQRLTEDADRIQLKLIPIALQTDDNEVELKNFAIFKRAAKQGHFTCQVQLAAWHQYIGDADTSQHGLRFARNKPVVSEAYFRHILESVRDLSNEIET